MKKLIASFIVIAVITTLLWNSNQSNLIKSFDLTSNSLLNKTANTLDTSYMIEKGVLDIYEDKIIINTNRISSSVRIDSITSYMDVKQIYYCSNKIDKFVVIPATSKDGKKILFIETKYNVHIYYVNNSITL